MFNVDIAVPAKLTSKYFPTISEMNLNMIDKDPF